MMVRCERRKMKKVSEREVNYSCRSENKDKEEKDRETVNKSRDDWKNRWPYRADQEKTSWKDQRYMQDYRDTMS